MATVKENPVQYEQKKRSNSRRYFNKKPEGERKESLPTLKYGKGNNFYAFQQALYRRALRDYGDLAKLISLNKYYEPTLDLPDFSGMGLSSAEQGIMRQEALKEHSKLIARMKLDRPKLYGLILEHMSVESKDEVAQDADYETWHKATDPEKLWQTIVKTHKVDCVSNVSQVKELTARKAYQQIKQGPFESLAYLPELQEYVNVGESCEYRGTRTGNGFLPCIRCRKVRRVQNKYAQWMGSRSV